MSTNGYGPCLHRICIPVEERGRRRQWHPTPVLLPGKPYGWRSLVGCSPWGREESDKRESEAAQSCPTLSNPMDCSLPDTSVHGIFQATAYTSCSISSQVLTQHIPWAPEAGKQAHPLMWNIPQTNGQSLCVCVCICVLLGGRAAGVGMGWGWVCSQGGLPGGGSPESTAKEGGVRGYC